MKITSLVASFGSLTQEFTLRDVVHIYHGILLNHKKENEIGSFAETWMDLETVIQSEASQKEKNKYSRIYVESVKLV